MGLETTLVDRKLAARIVAEGLVPPGAIDECQRIQAEFAERGLPLLVTEILVDRGLLDPEALARLAFEEGDEAVRRLEKNAFNDEDRRAVAEILLGSAAVSGEGLAESLRLVQELEAQGVTTDLGRVMLRRGHLDREFLLESIERRKATERARRDIDPFADRELPYPDKLFAAIAIFQGHLRWEVYARGRRIWSKLRGMGLEIELETILERLGGIEPEAARIVRELRDARLRRLERKTAPPPPVLPSVHVPRFGELLVREGHLSREQLEECLALQDAAFQAGIEVPLGEIAARRGLVSRRTVEGLLDVQRGLARRRQPATWIKLGLMAAAGSFLALLAWGVLKERETRLEERARADVESENTKRRLDRLLRRTAVETPAIEDPPPETWSPPPRIEIPADPGRERPVDPSPGRDDPGAVPPPAFPSGIEVPALVEAADGTPVEGRILSLRDPEPPLARALGAVRSGRVDLRFEGVERLLPDVYRLEVWTERGGRIATSELNLGNPDPWVHPIAARFESYLAALVRLEPVALPADLAPGGSPVWPPPFPATRRRLAAIGDRPDPVDVVSARIVFEHERVEWRLPIEWAAALANLLREEAGRETPPARDPAPRALAAALVRLAGRAGDELPADVLALNRFVGDLRLDLARRPPAVQAACRGVLDAVLGSAIAKLEASPDPGRLAGALEAAVASHDLAGFATREVAPLARRASRALDAETPALDRELAAIGDDLGALARIVRAAPAAGGPAFAARRDEFAAILGAIGRWSRSGAPGPERRRERRELERRLVALAGR